ncbi:conserved hypothetical protein [Microsporum canis CBS 113480]|uniref:Mitochondrial respiratory complex I chaperone n=1 Tax=Arthroderma otae (strain ATCC MYA-4605 / CBS 113480) TaxID=554155 RepID=C5FNU2_ARTOC|nr:conserved hypothetical protein [Microsporum canis CBS 113480]EEQ31795.1 conserved hypothetical protein [Microsporum canis CBS 113480]
MAGMFNSFLTNKPFVASRCYRHFIFSTRSHARPFRPILSVQRRQIFGFPTIRRVTETGTGKYNDSSDHGSKAMVQLVHALEQQSRPPPPFILATGFMRFIDKRLGQDTLTRYQAELLIRTFQHLLSVPSKDPQGSLREFLELENFEHTLIALSGAKFSPDAAELVNDLARSIMGQIRRVRQGNFELSQEPDLEVFISYITILSSTGFSADALKLTISYWKSMPVLGNELSPWVDIMKGFSKEARRLEAEKSIPSKVTMVLKEMERCGITLGTELQEQIISMLGEGDYFHAIKTVAGLPVERSTTANIHLLKFALRHSMYSWAATIASSLPPYPTPEIRDALLLFSLLRGRSLDSICKQLDEMTAKNPEIRATMTIDTINTIIEYANLNKQADVTNQAIQIAQTWGLTPNPRTYLLQIHSLVNSGQIKDAAELFQNLAPEVEFNLSDVDFLNTFIKQLCLLEKGVSTLLRPIIDNYDPLELQKIRLPFLDYIKDMSQSVDSAWEAYELLNLAMPTTPVSTRTIIMNVFFDRQRSDLASLVFGHMRQKGDPNIRPTSYTYARCFQGIAKAADSDSLHLVHNMLKLDLQVAPTTKIRNSLMLAYAACGIADQAMGIFRDILHSEEGPSERTLIIFFRVCESYDNGLEEATKMMEKLKSLDILINDEVYNAYIGALGAHCELELATQAIKAMESQTGSAPTILTLVNLYNSIPYQYWKDQAEEWAQVTYPKLWKTIEQSGRTKDEDGLQHLNIDRSVKA